MIGEIGGTDEEKAAEYIKQHAQTGGGIYRRPDRSAGAPHGARRPSFPVEGHGIKIAALRAAGITVSDSPATIGDAVVKVG